MRREHAPLILTALLLALVALVELRWVQGLRWLDEQQVDAFVRQQAASQKPDSDIVIVDIDEASLANPKMADEAGSWPWPRAIYAELIDKIEAQKPAAIVFDILFSEGDHFRPESDAAFVDALRGRDNIYLPMLRLRQQDDSRGRPLAPDVVFLGLVSLLLAVFFVFVADGVARQYWLNMDLYGWQLPSLPVRLARDKGWPVPAGAAIELAWRGKGGAFHHVSFADVYLDLEQTHPQRPADEFRNRIVVIGTSASGLQDLRRSPRSSVDQGVEILATAIDNLKNGRAMHEARLRYGLVMALLLLAAQLAAFMQRQSALPVGLALIGVSALLLGASWLAVAYGWRFPVLVPLLLAWVYYLAASVLAYLRERAARQMTVRMFGRFLNKEVVNQLVERGETIESLSGKSRQISILFSDIRGFTSLSEKRSPEEVVSILNRYFSRQVAVVFRHGGTLDLFFGVCIMAFWGAPLPDAEHARRAVACALEMEKTLLDFRKELGEEGATFDVGIGVHTGTAVVGFIGAEQKLEYTAIGDTVNLASRVEGLTNGVARFLVTAATVAACRQAYAFTPKGAFPVKGRGEQVELFEPRAL